MEGEQTQRVRKGEIVVEVTDREKGMWRVRRRKRATDGREGERDERAQIIIKCFQIQSKVNHLDVYTRACTHTHAHTHTHMHAQTHTHT